jgi:hypothetical protein
VIHETLAGQSSQIKQYTVAVKAFGRDPRFDPRTNNVARTEAGRLRQALRKYDASHGREDPLEVERPLDRAALPSIERDILVLAGLDRAGREWTP